MKVLIISNNAFSKSQNMGKTLSSIFMNFAPYEICQLFFYSSVPDNSICHDFYRVSDYDLVKGKFFWRTGQVITPSSSDTHRLFENEEVKKKYSSMDRNRPLIALMRTMLWKVSRWNSKKLKEWIQEMKPDCIFFASGDTVFSYKIAYTISRQYKLPIITYVCDEFYYGYDGKGFLGEIYRCLLRKWMNRVFKSSIELLSICEPMGQLYQRLFNVPYYVLYTGCDSDYSIFENGINKQDKAISYLGNLSLNRWRSLIHIGKALDTVNDLYSEDYRLLVYSGETNQEVISALEDVKSISFMGKISPEDCIERTRNSLAVIHTESFDAEDIKRVKYSMSTKIANALNSGTCIFAYGSDELVSIQYLIQNKCAIVANSEQELVGKLSQLIEDKNIRDKCIENARILANKNHNAYRNSLRFKENIDTLLRGTV